MEDLESDEISSQFSNHIFHTIQRMKRDLKNPHVKTYKYMDLDLDMLLAICKASTWFTTKQRSLLFLEDGRYQDENTSLQAELARTRAELAKARADLDKATRAASSWDAEAEAAVRQAIRLLTGLSERKAAAAQTNRANQLNPNNPNHRPPKKR